MKKLLTTLLIILLFITIIAFCTGCSNNESEKNDEPNNIEIMSYVQTVLDTELVNPKYSNKESDYNIIKTNLRYKIEGKVNSEKFWMIIEFVDNTYEEYDLISLQIGDKKYYNI